MSEYLIAEDFTEKPNRVYRITKDGDECIELIRENAMLEAKLRRYEQLLKIIGGECQQFLTDIEPKQTEQNKPDCEHCYYEADSYCDEAKDCGSCEHTDKHNNCLCLTVASNEPCPYFKEKDKTEPAEPLTAHWIICSDGYYPYCSNCKTEPKSGIMSKYCPECGRKMEDGK